MDRDARALRRSWLPWILLVLVAALALGVGAAGATGPATNEERALGIAKVIKCPICNGETVAESNVDISRDIRVDINRRIARGETDEQITEFYESKYPDMVLTPSSTGVVGLIWVLPVVALVAALAGLAVTFRRWSEPADTMATDADRDLVAHAQAQALDGDQRP